ncbi:MAG: MmcQ/YjbR family DNA-binding protein [Bacteroidetes bacterium]|nr:MmcQ/YjbR family DNA-binding protein [Bacteroidota bacterium]
MNIEQLRDFCIAKKSVTEEFPFDSETLVFKVKGKAFVLANIENFESLNVKCDPEKAIELREEHDAIIPGFHMNKKHWNTIKVDGTLSDKFIFEQVNHSYEQVVKGLPLKIQKELL